MPLSRQDVRADVVSLVTPYLTGAEVILDHYEDPNGRSPVVIVLSAGSTRPPNTAQGNASKFAVEIGIYVKRVGDGITEEDAANTLDLLEYQVAQFVEAKRAQQACWDLMQYDGNSIVDPFITVGGALYWREVIPLMITAFR